MGDINEYNDFFDDYFRHELSKIPRLFKVKKKVAYISYVLLAVFTVFVFAAVSYMYKTQELIELPRLSATRMPPRIATYDRNAIILVIVSSLVLALLALWIILCIFYEKRAFKRASKLANNSMIYREEVRNKSWQDYKATRDI